MSNKNPVKKEQFFELLSAVHNINTECEPDTDRGQNLNDTALSAVHTIFSLLEGRQPGGREGVELVIRLLAEVNCSINPSRYADYEIERGFNGDRTMDIGATIKLPENVPFIVQSDVI